MNPLTRDFWLIPTNNTDPHAIAPGALVIFFVVAVILCVVFAIIAKRQRDYEDGYHRTLRYLEHGMTPEVVRHRIEMLHFMPGHPYSKSWFKGAREALITYEEGQVS